MSQAPTLHDLYHVTDVGLARRREFIRLTPRDVAVLRRVARWGEQAAPAIASDFYDHQFTFSGTAEFFAAQAERKGVSLADLRAHLEAARPATCARSSPRRREPASSARSTSSGGCRSAGCTTRSICR